MEVFGKSNRTQRYCPYLEGIHNSDNILYIFKCDRVSKRYVSATFCWRFYVSKAFKGFCGSVVMVHFKDWPDKYAVVQMCKYPD